MTMSELAAWLFVADLIWFAGALFGVGIIWWVLVEARRSRERNYRNRKDQP